MTGSGGRGRGFWTRWSARHGTDSRAQKLLRSSEPSTQGRHPCQPLDGAGSAPSRRRSALLSTMAVLAIGAQPASADTVQTFACFSPLTSTYATFPIPVTGNGSPARSSRRHTDFTGISVAFAIDQASPWPASGPGPQRSQRPPASAPSTRSLDDPITGERRREHRREHHHGEAHREQRHRRHAGTFRRGERHVLHRLGRRRPGEPADLRRNVARLWTGSGTTGLVQVPVLPVPIPLGPRPVDSVTSKLAGGNITCLSARAAARRNPAGCADVDRAEQRPADPEQQPRVQANFYCWPGSPTVRRPDHRAPRLVARVHARGRGEHHRHRHGQHPAGARRRVTDESTSAEPVRPSSST